MTLDFSSPSFLKLSMQRALLGNVTANLAACCAKLQDDTITISAYFFGEPSDEDKEYIEVAATEVIADFPENYFIETTFALVSEVVVNTVKWHFLRAEAQSSTGN